MASGVDPASPGVNAVLVQITSDNRLTRDEEVLFWQACLSETGGNQLLCRGDLDQLRAYYGR